MQKEKEKKRTVSEQLGYKVKFIRSNTIKKIYLELTNQCNLDCIMCYRKNWNESFFANMSIEIFDKFCQDIKEIEGLEEIVLGGIGEPTYYEHFSYVIEKLQNYKLNITSNGTLLNDDLINKIISKVNSITISVDGVEEDFEKIRGIELQKIVDNIQRLEEIKILNKTSFPKVQLQFVASKKNIHTIFSVIDLASKLKCDKLIVSSLIPQEEFTKDDILYSIQSNEENEKLWDSIKKHGIRRGIKIQMPNLDLREEKACNFIDSVSTFINAKGEVVPCYRLSHDSKEYVFSREKKIRKHSFGNILDTSLLDLWNNKKYQQLRYNLHSSRYPSCIDCSLVEGCEYISDTLEDCFGESPSCGDCLWYRKFVVCP